MSIFKRGDRYKKLVRTRSMLAYDELDEKIASDSFGPEEFGGKFIMHLYIKHTFIFIIFKYIHPFTNLSRLWVRKNS